MVELIFRNRDFMPVLAVDNYESLIWATRYNDLGDFELVLPFDQEIFTRSRLGPFITHAEDDEIMIVERVKVESHAGTAPTMTITGYTASYMASWRLASTSPFDVEHSDLSVGAFINKLFQDSIRVPTDTNRVIPNFVYGGWEGTVPSSSVQTFVNRKVTVLDAIMDELQDRNFGFKTLLRTNTSGEQQIRFTLYNGIDRSPTGGTNNPVVFSVESGTLSKTIYTYDRSDFSNVAYVSGDQVPNASSTQPNLRISRVVTNLLNDGSLQRREYHSDASDLTKASSVPLATYYNFLEQRGRKDLRTKRKVIRTVEADALDDQYQYRRDYNLGDIVQVKTDFGVSEKLRISEMILKVGADGTSRIPTFEQL